MRHNSRWVLGVAVLLLACLQLSGCGRVTSPDESESKPAQVVPIAGTDISRVILTKDAANRLGIETSSVHDEKVRGALRKVIPYSALLYEVTGKSWVYTNPTPLTYVRASVKVDYITGNLVVLAAGPPSGTVIVTVGVPELYGTEFGVGDEA